MFKYFSCSPNASRKSLLNKQVTIKVNGRGRKKEKRENPDDSLLLPFFLTDVSMNNKFIVFDVVGVTKVRK